MGMSMQANAFRNWINLHLFEAGDNGIVDLNNDLKDGTKLLTLLEILSGSKLPRERGKLRVQCINNVNHVLHYLDNVKCELNNVNASDIVDGNVRATAALVWHIVQHAWMQYAKSDETFRGLDHTLHEALKQWCTWTLQQSGVEDVSITNFASSWTDGKAFCAILKQYKPDLVENWDEIMSMTQVDRLNFVFDTAKEHLHIEKLIEAEDLLEPISVDQLSVMLYVWLWMQHLPHHSLATPTNFAQAPQSPDTALVPASGSSTASSREHLTDSDTGDSTKRSRTYSHTLKEYQSTLEEVLVWLLEAEEHLKSQLPVCEADLDIVKRQFKEHEEFMLRLAQSQESVGKVLKHGQTLAKSGRLTSDCTNTVFKQIAVVNDKWENVRRSSMDRQTKLQDRLTYLQQEQLKAVLNWLDKTEHMIEQIEPLSTDADILLKQADRHRDVQSELEQQQRAVYRLSSFVAVVDRAETGEQSYTRLEKQLQDIGHRWMAICQWAERRANNLEGLSDAVRCLRTEHEHLDAWLHDREYALSQLTSAHHLTDNQAVQEQIQQLQQLELDMESEQARFVRYSQLSSLVISRLEHDNPSAAAQFTRKFESCTERWDNLATRMEEHSQTLVRTGQVEPQVFKHSWARAMARKQEEEAARLRAQAIKQEEHDKQVRAQQLQSSSSSSAKKRRVTDSKGADQDLFEVNASLLNEWLTQLHTRLTLLDQADTPRQQRFIIALLDSELETKTNEFAQLHDQASDMEQNKAVQQRLASLNSRWRQALLMLDSRRQSVEALAVHTAFQQKLAETTAIMDELQSWTSQFDSNKEQRDVASVRVALRKCQDRLDTIQKQQPNVQQLHEHVQYLQDKQTDEAEHALLQMNTFAQQFSSVAEQIGESLSSLEQSLDSAPEPSAEEAGALLEHWMEGAQDVLHMPALPHTDMAPVMDAKIEQLKELKAQHEIHAATLSLVDSPTNQHIKQQYESAGAELQDTIKQLETDCARVKQWHKDSDQLVDWIEQTQLQLAHINHSNDAQALLQKLSSELSVHGRTCVQLDSQASLMCEKGTDSLKHHVNQTVTQIDKGMADLQQAIKLAQTRQLEDGKASECLKESERITKLADSQLQSDEKPATSRDMLSAIKKIKATLNDLEECEESLDQVIHEQTANETMKLNAQTKRKQIALQIEQLRNRSQQYSQAVDQCKELQDLLAGEKICLEELQKRLAQPSKPTPDAEDYTEQLDLLDRLRHSGQSERIQELSAALAQNGLLPPTVSQDCDRLSQLKQVLLPDASARHEQLQSAVSDSQQFDSAKASCEQWMAHVTNILHARHQADIDATDVPDEYKLLVDDGVMTKQLHKEFEDCKAQISSLNAHASNCEKEYGAQAAQRIQQQVQHMQQLYEQLESQFAHFKRPREFETRVQRAQHRVNDLQQSVQNLPQKRTVQAQKEHCFELTEAIASVNSEIVELKELRDRLSADGLIDQKEDTERTLTQLTNQQTSLLQTLTESEQRVEEAEKVEQQLESHLAHLDEFMQGSEAQILKWESAEPSANIAHDQKWIQELQSELNRQTADWAQAEGLQHKLCEFSEEGAAALNQKLQTTVQRRHALSNKLTKWTECLANMEKDNESLVLEFESLVGEVRKWMADTRKQLAARSAIDPQQLHSLQSEQLAVRLQLDQLRDKAIELSARDEHYSTRVQPVLTDVNTNWEQVTATIQDLPVTVTQTNPQSVSGISLIDSSQSSSVSSTTSSSQLDGLTASTQTSTTTIVHMAQDHATTDTDTDTDTDTGNHSDTHMTHLMHKVKHMHSLMDFETQPVANHHEWSERCQQAQSISESISSQVGQVMEQGQHLANQGAMELEVQNQLQMIDDLCQTYNKTNRSISADLDRAAAVSAQQQELDTQTQTLVAKLDKALAHSVNTQMDRQVVQSDLKDVQSQLESIKAQHNHLNTQLPGTTSTIRRSPTSSKRASPSSDSSTVLLAKLMDKQEQLEHKLQNTARAQSNSNDKLAEQSIAAGTKVEAAPQAIAAVQQLDAQLSAMANVSLAVETAQTVTQLEHSLKLIENALHDDTLMPASAYVNFAEKADTLQALDSNLEAAESVISKLQTSVEQMAGTEPGGADKERLNLLLASVRTQVTRLKETKANKQTQFEARLQTWQDFQVALTEASQFLDALDERLEQSRQTSTVEHDVDTMHQKHTEIENELEQKAALLQKLSWSSAQMLPVLAEPEGALVKDKLDALTRRWHSLNQVVQDRRQLIEQRQAEDSDLKEQLSSVQFWCDETESVLSCGVDPTNRAALTDLNNRCQEHLVQLQAKQDQIRQCEQAKDKFLALKYVSNAAKHQVRRDLAETTSRLAKIRSELSRRTHVLADRVEKCHKFWSLIESTSVWARNTREMLEEFHSATIYTPCRFEPTKLADQVAEHKQDLVTLQLLWEEMVERAKTETDNGKVNSDTAQLYSTVKDDMTVLQSLTESLPDDLFEDTDTPGNDAHKLAHATDTDRLALAKKRAAGQTHTTDSAKMDESTTSTENEKPVYSPIMKQSRPSDTNQPLNLPTELNNTINTHVVDYDLVMPLNRVQQQFPNLSAKGHEHMRELTHLKHWLQDNMRDTDKQVDLVDLQAMKQASKTQQTFLDNLQSKRLGIIRILEDSREPDVQHKAELLSHEWERAVFNVNRRKRELSHMIEDAREWDHLRTQVDLWLAEGKQCTLEAAKTKDMDTTQLHEELAHVKHFIADLDSYKDKMNEINQRTDKLLDRYAADDATALSHTTSDLNTQWSKLNDNLRIRRAVLEASIRSRKDLQTALGEFEEWQHRMSELSQTLLQDTDNTQAVKDPHNRRIWIERHKELEHEISAHADVLQSITEMGDKLLESMDAQGSDRVTMHQRLHSLTQHWHMINNNTHLVRTRLEEAQEQWEKLTTALKELIYWTDNQDRAVLHQSPVGGDLLQTTEQMQYIKTVLDEIEQRESAVKDTIKETHSYLVQQDLRPINFSSAPEIDMQADPEEAHRRQARRLAQQLKVESDTLDLKWKQLKDKSDRWYRIVEEALQQFAQFDKAIETCDLNLLKLENSRSAWKQVQDIQLDDLPEQMHDTKTFKHRLMSARIFVDDVNEQAARLLADNVQLSPAASRTLDALNKRYKALHTHAQQRTQALEHALNDFGPSSQHFLMASVLPPVERSVAANRVPFYVNHDTEKTTWDHPKMTDLMSRLCDFNEVKFSAYRTGMKLRAIQKRLFLDLLRLDELVVVLEGAGLGQAANERVLDVSQLVMLLLALFEKLHQQQPTLLKSLPLAIDMCLNYLLNVYDPARGGSIRLLSVKVALCLLCCADLEDKYTYLFNLVASGGGVDQKKLALLLWDCMQLPKFLGEVAAFGGTNVEPSVRSCFQRVQYPHTVTLEQYLDWLKCEPQSLVWLPVLHRVAASEACKHQAKCNVCKMFPIVGMRYRCLKCFNFDMCQNCFFSQRQAKGHKPIHPMKEYCIATTSGEDVKDFGRVVKNKILRGRSRSPRVGYLPLQSVNEGACLQAKGVHPTNPRTEHLHNKLDDMAKRLRAAAEPESPTPTTGTLDQEHKSIAALSTSLGRLPPNTAQASTVNPPVTQVPQSPAQIVRTIDHMQKEELDNILRQLESENAQLQVEYDRLRASLGNGGLQQATSTPQLMMTNGSLGRRHHSQQPHSLVSSGYRSMGQLSHGAPGQSQAAIVPHDVLSEEDLLAEARALRQHKHKLEHRSRILEEHNLQLEAQLLRLKHLIMEQHTLTSDSPQQMTLSPQPEQGSIASSATANGHNFQLTAPAMGDEQTTDSGVDHTSSHMETLMHSAADLGRAMNNLVNTVTSDDEMSPSDDEQAI